MKNLEKNNIQNRNKNYRCDKIILADRLQIHVEPEQICEKKREGANNYIQYKDDPTRGGSNIPETCVKTLKHTRFLCTAIDIESTIIIEVFSAPKVSLLKDLLPFKTSVVIDRF